MSLMFVLLAGLLIPGSAPAQSFARGHDRGRSLRRLMVVVGVNEFLYPRPAGSMDDALGWPTLSFAEKDALDISSSLESYGFELFGEPLLGERATASDVTSRLAALLEEVSRNESEYFEIIIYFSSHGFELEDGSARTSYIATHDTPPRAVFALRQQIDRAPNDDPARRKALHQGELIDLLKKMSSNVLRSALIFDACYVAGGKVSDEPEKGDFFARSATEGEVLVAKRYVKNLRRGSFVLSAVSPGQRAREDAQRANSLYTHYLVRALTSDRNRLEVKEILPGYPLSLFAAHLFAAKQVEEIRGRAQTPSWSAPNINEGAGFFFLEADQVDTTTISPILIVEPPHDVTVTAKWLGAGEKGDGEVEVPRNGALSLSESGEYLIRIRSSSGDIELERRVELENGMVHTIFPILELRKRPRHVASAGIGYEFRGNGWGMPGDLPPQPIVFLRYGLFGWPWTTTETAFRVALGQTSTQVGSIDPEPQRIFTVSAVTELLAGSALGISRLDFGPRLGVDLIRRETEGTQGTELLAALRVGLLGRLAVPASTELDVVLGAAGDLHGTAFFSQSYWSAELHIGIAYRTPTNLPGDSDE